MQKPTETSWGKVAGWYDEMLSQPGTFQQEVILPNLLRRMAIKKSDEILDLACGQGFFSRAFAQEGAHVVGTDISKELISYAEKQLSKLSINQKKQLAFHAAPADDASFIKDHTIDHVTIVLAIQNIEDIKAVFTEAARVLKPAGKMHLVLNHPAFRIPKATEWGWDEAKKIQYRRIDMYLSESKHGIQMHPGDKPEELTTSFHRSLQYYFKVLAKAGFCVSGLEEWVSHKMSDSGPRAKAENRARAEFPLFLYLEARGMIER